MNGIDKTSDNSTSDAARMQIRLSKQQKTMLQRIMHKNPNLQEGTFTMEFTHKSAEKLWSNIAIKLNSIPGAQKTWIQWRRTWQDIKKNSRKSEYNYEGFMDHGLSTEEKMGSDDVCISKVGKDDDDDETEETHLKRQRAKNTPNASQLNFMIKEISDERGVANPNIWTSLSKKLNALGNCVKSWREWKQFWKDYKSNVKASVNESGTKNLNNLQRLTYEHMKGERKKNISNSSVLTEFRLQHLQRTADQECNVVGGLVAVKLHSMQKEQKLIAEKLISEILFQGQMEMFQYSDKAVNIPGYM